MITDTSFQSLKTRWEQSLVDIDNTVNETMRMIKVINIENKLC